MPPFLLSVRRDGRELERPASGLNARDPRQVTLLTTGAGRARLSPNLYSDGTVWPTCPVCISLPPRTNRTHPSPAPYKPDAPPRPARYRAGVDVS